MAEESSLISSSILRRRVILAILAVIFQWSKSVWAQGTTLETIIDENKSKFDIFPYTTPRSKSQEVIETGARTYNLHFCHLLGILKLAWYLKNRYLGTFCRDYLSST